MSDVVPTSVRARTARIPHLCEGCQGVPSLRDVPTIAPGHRYLLHTAFPDGLTNASDAPYSLKECVACAEERDLTMRGTHLACCTFCCGDVPCARPFKHDGDHSCRRCPSVRGAGPAAPPVAAVVEPITQQIQDRNEEESREQV